MWGSPPQHRVSVPGSQGCFPCRESRFACRPQMPRCSAMKTLEHDPPTLLFGSRYDVKLCQWSSGGPCKAKGLLPCLPLRTLHLLLQCNFQGRSVGHPAVVTFQQLL